MMGALKVVAPAPASDGDLVYNSYVTNTLLPANLPQATVDSLISTGLSSYATRAYVNSQDALLATQAYVNAGDATRLHLSQVGVDSGIAGLDSTGRVDAERVAVPSTQQWPKAFWSPSSYNASSVAATAETTMYTCAVSDPGFTYKLVVFGAAQGKVNIDTGEYPIIYVRVGSTSGQIIAFGAGTAEYYQGPAGNTASSRATLGSFAATNEEWTTVTGWSAQNTGGYVTTLSSNHIVIPSTMSASMSASVTYSGATVGILKPSPSVGIRIVSDTGSVLATGAEVSGTSGTATVSWSGSVTIGQLYRIEMGVTGAETPPTATTGYFQVIGPKTDNTGPITVLPYSLASQTAKTGATTLYIRVRRSGSSSTVTALTSYPNLYVMAVPA